MTGRDYRLGRVTPGLAAERIPNLHPTGGHDRRTAAQYLADLAAETERSLLRSPRWRAGKPLLEEERWPRLSSGQLGNRSGIPPHGGRWPQ